MCEWATATVEDIAAPIERPFAMGPFGSRIKKDNYRDSGVPVIRGGNLQGVRFNDEGYVFLEEEKAEELSASVAEPGDVVFVAQGGIGQVGLIPSDGNYDRFILSQNLMKVTVDPAKAHPGYVFYYFRSRLGQHEILSYANPTGVPCISRPLTSLKSFSLPLPPLEVQDRIAHILGTLDDKIELNRRMNRTLEAIARAIFKSWFIDFDPVIDNAILNGKPIPDEFAERAAVRREMLARSQPSPLAPLPEVEGRNYRGGFDFSGFVETARELRKKQTSAEEILWGILRDRQFLGLKFRRQHQIGDYIADFYCHEHKLVLELDGGIHRTQGSKDAKRDAYMQSLGLTVLRIPNADVLENPDGVLSRITEVVQSSPSPAGRGGGEDIEDLSPSTFGRGARGEGVASHRHLFPDSFQDSPLGMIPRGWEVQTVDAICKRIENGGTPKRMNDEFWDGGIPWYKTGELRDAPLIGSSESISALGMERSSCKLWPPGTILIALYASPTVGRLGLLTESSAANQACSALIADDPDEIEFLFHSMLQTRERLQRYAVGAAQQNISQRVVREHYLVTPPKNLVHVFDARVAGIRQQQIALLKQSAVLGQSRNSLLPELLSGRLDTSVVKRRLNGD